MDAIISNNLIDIIEEVNSLKISKEKIVTLFQNKEGKYVLVFYK